MKMLVMNASVALGQLDVKFDRNFQMRQAHLAFDDTWLEDHHDSFIALNHLREPFKQCDNI